ncbi:MAG: hypothetical protein RLZZ180_1984 [Pseudomonadota bacterium]|jgi:hypothetical protein
MLHTEARDLPYDELYEALIASHEGLSAEQSHLLNARLVLLLANQIGDAQVLRAAFSAARAGLPATAAQTPQ